MKQGSKIRNKKAILFIDTSNNEKISVGVEVNGEKEEIGREIDTRKAQAVLPMIDEILRKNRLKISDLTYIEVVEGPGSYTGLRVGIAIANALSFALNIPINNKSLGEFVDARY